MFSVTVEGRVTGIVVVHYEIIQITRVPSVRIWRDGGPHERQVKGALVIGKAEEQGRS
jgi:hypothetical protein